MGRLLDSYLSARGVGAVLGEAGSPDPELAEQALEAAFTRGRAAHPLLVLDETAFAAHLGRCGAAIEPNAATACIHAEDLYLCCAALGGDDAAVAALRTGHHTTIGNHLRAINSSPAFVEEVEQKVWEAALIGSIEAPPKLWSYSGKGPLAAWTGVVAQRIALTHLRHDAAERRAHDRAALEALPAATDPELAFLKEALRERFQRAVIGGIESLDDRQCMIYRLHVVDGLSVERIGEMYGVVRSTVTRWLADARRAIVEEAKRLLRDEMQLPAEDFDSLARLLTSQLELSVSRLLGSRAP